MNEQILEDYTRGKVKDKELIIYFLLNDGFDYAFISSLNISNNPRYFKAYCKTVEKYYGVLKNNNEVLKNNQSMLKNNTVKKEELADSIKVSTKEFDVRQCIGYYIEDNDIKEALKAWYADVLPTARRNKNLPSWNSISANLQLLYNACNNDRDRVLNAILFSTSKHWREIAEKEVQSRPAYNNTYTSNTYNKQYAESNAKPAYNNERNTYDNKQPTKGWYADTPGSVPIDPNRSKLVF